MERHTKASPCLVCGGAKSDKQGKGERCWGFSSEGNEWVHCTREKLAGSIPRNEKSNAFPHKIGGPCDCGTEHAPGLNGNGHKIYRSRKKLRSYVYELRDENGELQAKHVRREYDTDEKDFIFIPSGVKSEALPLYGVPDLLKLPKGSKVIVTEGEKKADALKAVGFNVVATATGAPAAPYKKSLQVLVGYTVYLWPDNDDVGRVQMEKVAASLRELGVKPFSIVWDQAPKKGDAEDYLAGGGTAEGVTEMMNQAKLHGLSNWEEPIPIENLDKPPFPTAALPEWLAEWVKAVSEEIQAPTDLAAMLSMSILACAVAKKYKVHIRGNWTEPLNLMVAVALPPGERKSAIFAEAIKPILQYEKENMKDWLTRYQLQKVEYEMAERRLSAAMKEGEKADEPNMAKINTLAATFAGMKKPVIPSLFVDDVTMEKLGQMLAEQNGKLAIFSDEGGIFTILAGKYSDGVPTLDPVLKGHSGNSMRVHRVGRDANIIDSPALTLGLAVQPGVLADFGEKKEFMSRGLIARFLYSIPQSMVGNRASISQEAPESMRDRFNLRIRMLLNRPEHLDEYGEVAPTFVKFSEKALEMFLAYAADIESRLRADGDLQALGGWAEKLAGALARIAAILHLANHSADPEGIPLPEISEQEIVNLMEIGDYLIAHVKTAFGIIGSYSMEEASKILEWLKKESINCFSKQQAWKRMKGHLKKAKELDAPLKLLVDLGYIKELELPAKRGRPSEKFNVWPGLF